MKIVVESIGMTLIFGFIAEMIGKNYGMFFMFGAATIYGFLYYFTKKSKRKEDK